MNRHSLLLLSILLFDTAFNVAASDPIHVASPNPYEIHEQHQQQPAVLAQPRNYYQYPQYLPTNAGYSSYQSVGQPYQMYSSSSSDASYGFAPSAPAPTPTPVPAHVPVSPVTPPPLSSQFESQAQEHHQSRAPAPLENQEKEVRAFIPVPVSAPSPSLPSQKLHNIHEPTPQIIAPKPVLSYAAANPFLANLPPAQGPYGAPIIDSADREDSIRAFYQLNRDSSPAGYASQSASAPAPPPLPASSSSIDDTWEALEASLEASARRRHRFN
uniref:Uncharacterized protein n=1 Tax=Caenorhabditis japonica TaxID=281687 RepID=A0A8R1HJ62_CAEJA